MKFSCRSGVTGCCVCTSFLQRCRGEVVIEFCAPTRKHPLKKLFPVADRKVRRHAPWDAIGTNIDLIWSSCFVEKEVWFACAYEHKVETCEQRNS